MPPFGGIATSRNTRGQGHQIFVEELTRFADQAADQRIKALADRTAAPLRVAVRGRRGVGCSTVADALDRAGSPSGIRVTSPGDTVDLQVHVLAEVAKPEDTEGPCPSLAVLNKADVTGLGADGPIVAASRQCARLSGQIGAPVLPISGLLAVAALDDLDAHGWAGLRTLAAHPGGAACLDGSFDGFLTARLPVPATTRARLLQVLGLFGVALGVAAIRQGAGPAQVRALWRRVSGVDAVIERLVAAGAEVHYRRVLEAVAELEVLAVSDPTIAAFLSRDDTVIARMAAALDAVAAAGLAAGPDAPLPRAVHWQRDRRTSVSEVHRACAADIARGSLRLWSRAGGAPLRAAQ